jgi:hypothetical protein
MRYQIASAWEYAHKLIKKTYRMPSLIAKQATKKFGSIVLNVIVSANVNYSRL